MSSPPSLQWLSLVGTIWLQTINGANSDFPVYSSQLKDLKHISQMGINFLAFASDAGKLLGWFSGVAAGYLPLWLVAVVGASLGLVGYGLQFLFLHSSRLTYMPIFILTAMAGNGICWINTACYLTCIKNFPSDSRVAVGLSTSYVGLSAKVYTVLAAAIFSRTSKHDAKSYLLLNAVAPMLVAVVVAPFLRPAVPGAPEKRRSGVAFVVMFVITLATGVCAVMGSINQRALKWFSLRKDVASLSVLLAAPLLIPAALRFKEDVHGALWSKETNKIHDVIGLEEVESGVVDQGPQVKESDQEGGSAGPLVEESSREQVGGLQMLTKVDFWLYFFSYMFTATLGFVYLNNLGQIAESRGLEDTSTLVSLSSSFGFFGRLMPFILDYCASGGKNRVSRPASMASLMAPMAGAFFALVHPSKQSLYISTAVIGACTGAITSIAVSATTELFGTKHFSVNHNIVVTNIPIGSFVFGFFAAVVYQRRAGGGVGGRSSHSCIGAGCYEQTFITWGCACALGTVLCTLLYVRIRRSRLADASTRGS